MRLYLSNKVLLVSTRGGLVVGEYGTQSVALMFGSVSHFRGTGRSGYTKDHPVFAARCIQMGQKDGTTHHYDWALSFLV